MDYRLVLKFPQRRVLVQKVSMTRLEVALLDVSDVQVRGPVSEFVWPDWHHTIQHSAVDSIGYIREWVEDYKPDELKDLIEKKYRDNCTVKALDAMKDFKGYLTIENGQFALTDGHTVLQLARRPSEGITRVYQMPFNVMSASNFFNKTEGPFIKNPILKKPYTLTHCWCGNTGDALIDLEEFLLFVDRHMNQIADPFAWDTIKPSSDPQQQVVSLASALAMGADQMEAREFLLLHEEEIPWPKF
jgi:hypothetical protein